MWVDRITPKASIKNSPFFLVYGQEAILPTHIFLSSLQFSQSVQESKCPIMQRRINTLLQLEEERQTTQNHFNKHQHIVKSGFDKKFVGEKDFNIGDLVLKWDKLNESKGKHSKFQRLLLGSFQIDQKLGLNTFKLRNLEGKLEPLPVNRQVLKSFFS